MVLKLLVLELEPLEASLRNRLGEYAFANAFIALFQQSLVDLGRGNETLQTKIIARNDDDQWHWETLLQEAQTMDAVVLPGSFSSAYESKPWIETLKILIRRLVQIHHVPIVGACFGHQVVAEALGGKVVRNPAGLELGLKRFELDSEGGRMAFGEENMSTRTTLDLYYIHHDCVVELPVEAVSIGGNAVSPCQGYVIPGHALMVQGHPEFGERPEILSALIETFQEGYEDKEEVRKAKQALRMELHRRDHRWVGMRMIEFIETVKKYRVMIKGN